MRVLDELARFLARLCLPDDAESRLSRHEPPNATAGEGLVVDNGDAERASARLTTRLSPPLSAMPRV